jgi:signal transduction histidine kinase
VQFVAVGLVTAAVLALVTGWLSQRAARDEAIQDALAANETLARTVIQPALSSGLTSSNAADVDRFDRLVRRRALDGEVLRLKIWNTDGQIVYSDEPRLIGETFDLDPDELRVLAQGGSEAEVSDLAKSENRYDQPLGRVLEVYTQVVSPDGQPLLFESYFSYDDLARRTDQVVGAFRPITVGGILFFLILTAPLVWLLARRLDEAAQQRERLLYAAVQASDGERRRIARDLHDGVVQDLTGTSYALSATSRELSAGGTKSGGLAHALDDLAMGMRDSLRALRSLLVEIYPDDLGRHGLPAALNDLLATATASGVRVTLDVPDSVDLPENVNKLLWRSAQELVRNALRHGEPAHLSVRLTVTHSKGSAGREVMLEVWDDGHGFDASTTVPAEHFGLRGLTDLAKEMDGDLVVTSVVGEGTTASLKVLVDV